MRQKDQTKIKLPKCDWCLAVAVGCLLLSSWVIIDPVGNLSVAGFEFPIKIVSTFFTFTRITWGATAALLVVSLISRPKSSIVSSLLSGLIDVLAGVSLVVKFNDVAVGTYLEGASQWCFVALMVCGWWFGDSISLFVSFLFKIRSKKESESKGLPRVPDIVLRGMGGSLLLCVISVPILFAIFKWWLPSKYVMFGAVAVGIGFVLAIVQDVLMRLRMKNDGLIGLFLDMIDRRLQMSDQMNRFKPQMAAISSPEKFGNPRDLQLKQAQAIKSSFDYKCEWRFIGEDVATDDIMLTFSGCEHGVPYNSSIPQTAVMPYLKAMGYGDVERIDDVPRGVIEKAAYYATLNAIELSKGLSLLWHFVCDMRVEDLQTIIDADTNINRVYASQGGWTALMMAVAQGFSEGVRLLLRKGADPDVRNTNGVTPILWAVRYNNLECLKLRYEAGANIRVKDAEGCNALVVAAKNGSKDVVQYLIDHGVKPNQPDAWGHTALYYAQERKHGEIAVILRRQMSGNGKNVRAKKRR